VSGYALAAAKRGLKLKKAGDSAREGYIFSDGLRRESISMSPLAAMLTLGLKQSVVDKTGITGELGDQSEICPE
jgi:uncharacterized protein (TIGR03435 family)